MMPLDMGVPREARHIVNVQLVHHSAGGCFSTVLTLTQSSAEICLFDLASATQAARLPPPAK